MKDKLEEVTPNQLPIPPTLGQESGWVENFTSIKFCWSKVGSLSPQTVRSSRSQNKTERYARWHQFGSSDRGADKFTKTNTWAGYSWYKRSELEKMVKKWYVIMKQVWSEMPGVGRLRLVAKTRLVKRISSLFLSFVFTFCFMMIFITLI